MNRLRAELTKPERIVPVLRVLTKRDWTSRLLTRALKPFNPFDPQRYSNPYPLYEELRAAGGPVYFHERAGTWHITGFEECEQALRGPVSVDRSDLMANMTPYKNVGPESSDIMNSMMLMVDPPDHTRLRKLVSRAFTPRAVAQLEPEVWKVAGGLLDQLETQASFDVMETYCSQLPIYMIGEMLGLPSEQWPRLKELSDVLARFVDPITAFDPIEMDAALAEVSELLTDEFESRRANPRDDLLSALVAAEEDGDRLSMTELISMVTLLMVAGHETTTGLLGNALLLLDTHPDARQQLIDQPDLADNAVEEFLRYDSPVQGTDRIALEDFEIGGHKIAAGDVVGVLLGAANRDPRVHDAPNELRLDRKNPRPLSFGHGVHHCVGAALARLEAKVAIPAFLDRFPDYAVQHDQLDWKRSITLRGPSKMVVTPRS